MITDPSFTHVMADLEEGNFISGRDADRWRIIVFTFPQLDFTVSATNLDGTLCEYGFQADLSNYPAQPPMVRIWDHVANTPLAGDKRPKGSTRIERTFQQWGSDTVYRPWDRMTGPHGNNADNFPHLAWRPDRRLSFIFEDLYGILNSNARAQRIRAAA